MNKRTKLKNRKIKSMTYTKKWKLKIKINKI